MLVDRVSIEVDMEIPLGGHFELDVLGADAEVFHSVVVDVAGGQRQKHQCRVLTAQLVQILGLVDEGRGVAWHRRITDCGRHAAKSHQHY